MRRAKELRLPLWQRAELVAFWAIAGFGHRPLRVVGSAIVSVLCYALLYWSIGGIVSTSSVEQMTLQHAVLLQWDDVFDRRVWRLRSRPARAAHCSD